MHGRALIPLVLATTLLWPTPGMASGRAVGGFEGEYWLSLSRAVVSHGRITFSIANDGQDEHDLVIARKGRRYARTGRIAPGGHVNFSARLPRGTYVLYCGLPGHRAAGMHTKIVVR